MPQAKLSCSSAVWAIFLKDALCEFRTRYAVGALIMFAVTTIASVSMAISGAALQPVFIAVLLWVVLFFCAMAGLARSFVQEQETGTILGLRLYAPGEAVFGGKLFFNICLQFGLTIFVIPLFIIFLTVNVDEGLMFALIVALGNIGIAAVATLTASMIIYAQGKQAVFTILTFPVLLPQFLSSIDGTIKVLAGGVPDVQELIFMAGYDAAVISAGILLFDYLWQE